ncbi:MAG TPA: hypothetical protein IAA65_00605 [Candidatus Galloscillospira excrementipullorum]|nr:hypothetical protein [Candidatus Galloscillospira excrementipullorum]
MTQREDGIQVLGEREQQELADRLMTFLGSRPSGKVTALRWDEIGSQFPALAAYTPQTLQFYTGLCDDLGLLRGFYDDGEVFSMDGLSRLGRLWGTQQRTLHKQNIGDWVYYFFVSLALGLMASLLRENGIL